MSDENQEMSFEEILTEFFNRYRVQKVRRASKIASQFKGQEKQVLYSLCKKYDVEPDKIADLIDLSEYTDIDSARNQAAKKVHQEVIGGEHEKEVEGESFHEEGESTETAEIEPPKKSKKLLIIIIFIIALAGGGAGFYVVDSGLLDGGHDATPTEDSSATVSEMEAPEIEHNSEESSEDSTHVDATESDSAKTDDDVVAE